MIPEKRLSSSHSGGSVAPDGAGKPHARHEIHEVTRHASVRRIDTVVSSTAEPPF
jgi:hypothetical protein